MKRNCFAGLFALLALSLALAAPAASAQEVPVTTDDVVKDDGQVGQTITVPIRVSDLDKVADVTSYQFDVSFSTDKLTFERFDTSNTLTEDANFAVSQTDSSNANSSGTATIGATSTGSTTLSAGGNSGVMVKAVFTLDKVATDTVDISNFTFNGGDVAANLSEADFEVIVADNTASVVVEPKATNVGTTLRISGSDYTGLDIKSFDLEIQFPDGVTAPSSGAATVLQDGFTSSSKFDSQTGVLSISAFSQSGNELKGGGTFLEIKLNAVSSPGRYDFEFNRGPSGFQDSNQNTVKVALDGATLTFESAVTISEARGEGVGAGVSVEGTVTRAMGGLVRMQDSSGTTGASGLLMEVPSDVDASSIQQGTNVQVTGTLSETPGGVLQFAAGDVTNVVVEGQGSLPGAQSVGIGDLSGSGGEDYESELVRLGDLRFANPDTTGGTFNANTTYMVVDSTGAMFRYHVGDSTETQLVGSPINPGTFTYTGVVGQSSSGYRLVPIQTSTALPVELASFEAKESGSSVRLTWTTASETNNAGFRVEHSGPGQASGWQQLGYVRSKASGGTSTETTAYSFAVGKELSAGTHKFRLRQVDLDGSTQVAGQTTIEVQMDEALTLTAPSPNPTSGQATVSFGVKKAQKTRVVVYNVLGQRVKTIYDGTPQAGETQRVSFDASRLPSGAYFLQIRSGGQTKTARMTVVR